MTNILILSAGRRVELVQAFQRTLQERLPGSKVVAADAQRLAPALYRADEAVILPRLTASTYLDELRKTIVAFDIQIVIPTIDPELPLLATHRQEIETRTGARVVIAEPWVTRICNDKILTQKHICANGLLAPFTYDFKTDVADKDFPVVVKPRAGSSSVGVHIAYSREELNYFTPRTKEPMVQHLVRGDEYTVDCFCDFNGNVVTVVPRLRIATRAGEILKGRIVKDRDIIMAVKSLLQCLPIPGHSTVQCFKTERGVEFIEVNPRFGGGAPMSIAAGADSCSNLLRLVQGERLSYHDDYEDGLTFLRYDQAVMVRDETTWEVHGAAY